jgi:DNA-binding response OmpR family regulator
MTAAANPAAPLLANIQILIVEDDDTIRELLGDILSLEGADVTTAVSGNEARSLLRTTRPQLIISDVMMTDGDGHDLLRHVQADPLLNGIPFIFLTARSEPTDLRRSMNLGADDYLIKPVARQDLINAVRTRLVRSKVAGRCQRQMLDQFRDELARSVPHELLTPLHTIRGATEILSLEPGLGEGGKELVGMILQGCDRMTRTVKRFWRWNELQFDLKNRAAGQVPSRREVAHTDRIVELANVLFGGQGREDDLRLDLMPLRLPISEEHLRLMAQELIENALKFSPRGQKVEISLRETSAGWSLTFADHGVGMSAEQVAAVGPLRQFDRPLREQQGPGLGLAIVSAVAKLNGLLLKFDCTRPKGIAITLSPAPLLP